MDSKYAFNLFSIIILINVLTIISFKIDFNDLNQSLDKENSILDSFDKYLSSEENRIFRLRQTYEHFRQQNTIALKDKELFLSHPNDVYLLIKRITIEWKTVEELLEPNKRDINEFRTRIIDLNPSQYNYTDAVDAYEHLIYYYEQNISSAANGLIEYKTSFGEHKVFKSLSNKTFDAFDCYSMGMQSFHNKDSYYAMVWFEEGLSRAHNKTDSQIINKITELTKRMFKNENTGLENNQGESNINQESIDRKPEIIERSDYLCLGRKLIKPLIETKLKCFYLNTTLRPYLRLTRIRVEELYKRPQIVLIHNFLSETEAQTVLNTSKHSMRPSRVIDGTGQVKLDPHRISYTNSIAENHQDLEERINRRISEITGLNLVKNKDKLTIVRYTVGGLYDIHHDISNITTDITYDRIITWLNYLTDVGAGGATVIPRHNITIFPEKYSSVLWYNDLSSHDVDDDSLHTGCPVLYGYKWITQTHNFIKDQTRDRCALNRRQYRSLDDLERAF